MRVVDSNYGIRYFISDLCNRFARVLFNSRENLMNNWYVYGAFCILV